MPSHNSLRQQLLKRCTNHPPPHNDVSSEVKVPQNLIAEAVLCLVSSIIQNLIYADIQRQWCKWYRVAALFLRKLKMCAFTDSCTHHVPLCTYVGSRPQDDQETDVFGQLKEILHIPVSTEIVAARRLLVVVPGDVPSTWTKCQWYPNTPSSYFCLSHVVTG